jgi:hypothetical protein
VARKIFLQNELRRIEWRLKEARINALYDAQNFRREEKEYSQKNYPGEKNDDAPRFRLYFTKEGKNSTARENAYLSVVVSNIGTILEKENPETIEFALQPIASEIRAHFYAVKQTNPQSSSLSDYWIVWALVTSVINHSAIDTRVLRYSSKSFRTKFSKIAEEFSEIQRRDPTKIDNHEEVSESVPPDTSLPADQRHKNETDAGGFSV